MMITAADVVYYQGRIRTAYRQLAAMPGAWVPLTYLRDQVGGHRELVDAALRQLDLASDVNIVPESNRKSLDEWDHECAVRIGDQDCHMIAIES